MKRFACLFALAALLLPTLAFGETGEASKQTVTVTGEVYVPPPPTVVVDVSTPPPPTVVYAEPQPPPPTVVYAEPQPAYATVAVGPEMDYGRPVHQLSVGVGVPLCFFASVDLGEVGGSGSACVNDEFIWLSFPIGYRYRLNDYLAVGGGLMITAVAAGGYGTAFASLLGSFRVYAIPDWLYFEASLTFGFPFFVGFMPSVGVAIPLGSVSIFLENQVPLYYFGGLFGYWQPVLGVEFAF